MTEHFHVLLSLKVCAARANFPGVEDSRIRIFLAPSHAKDAKFGNQFLFFAPFAFFARDIPRPTGARSAPYENLRVLRAFVVKTILNLIRLRLCRAKLFVVRSLPLFLRRDAPDFATAVIGDEQ